MDMDGVGPFRGVSPSALSCLACDSMYPRSLMKGLMQKTSTNFGNVLNGFIKSNMLLIKHQGKSGDKEAVSLFLNVTPFSN